MLTAEQAIESISKRLKLINDIDTVEKFNNWHNSTVLTLATIYGENDTRVQKLEKIEAYVFYFTSGKERISQAKEEAKSLLDGLVSDIKDLGLPFQKSTSTKGINISMNQNNHQNQSTKVNIGIELFIDAIKDELKGSQIKELKSILESEDEPEQKKVIYSIK